MDERSKEWERYRQIVKGYEGDIQNVEKLEDLFKYWKQAHEKCKTTAKEGNLGTNWGGFAPDGFLGSRNMFNMSELKVLFILREPNDPCPDGNFWFKEDVVEADRNGGRLGSRVRMIYAYLSNEDNPECEKCSKASSEELKYAAYMNLNKRGGGSRQSKDLQEYVNTFCVFIKKEIDIINPEIIVCGGTFKFLKKFYDEDKKQSNEPKWIDCWHPSNHKSNAANMDMIREN